MPLGIKWRGMNLIEIKIKVPKDAFGIIIKELEKLGIIWEVVKNGKGKVNEKTNRKSSRK